MMPIDPNIALQVRPAQFDDPLTVRTKQLQLRDLMAQGQVRDMQLQQAQQAQVQQQTLADVYRESGGDYDKTRALLAARGLGSQIPAFDKSTADTKARLTQADAEKFELAKKRMDVIHGELSTLLVDPQLSQEKVIARIAALAQAGILSPEDGATLARNLPPEPGRLRNELVQFGLAVQDNNTRLQMMLPKTEMKDTGGQQQVFQTNQLTGQVIPGQSFAKTMTPGEVASNQVALGNLGVARERLKFDKEQPKGVYDAERGMLIDPRTGQAQPVMSGGQPIAPKKPSDQAQKVSDANEAIALLNQADPLLKNSTGSYTGNVVDTLAQAFGMATPGAISAQKLKALEGALVAKMPKMSGPQSDKDVLLYRQMAGQIGDPTLPYEAKAAALETVREIQERYAGMAPGSSNTARKISGTLQPAAPGSVLKFDAQGNPIP